MRQVVTFILFLTIQINSGIGIGESNQGALPVELTSLSASLKGNNVELSWTTASEVNNFGFEVQKTDFPIGDESQISEWKTVGFVKGGGNSNSVKEYFFTDFLDFNFRYRLKQIDNNGRFVFSKEIEVKNLLSMSFSLSQNYPNPFNPSTVISYSIPKTLSVKLEVYNVLGKIVGTLVNETQDAGVYSISFNAKDLSSGVYYYTIQAGTYFSTKKMIYLR